MKYCIECKKPFIEIERELKLGIERCKCPFCEPYYVAPNIKKDKDKPIIRRNKKRFKGAELIKMRQLVRSGKYTQREIAKMYDCNDSTISLWKDEDPARRLKKWNYGKL